MNGTLEQIGGEAALRELLVGQSKRAQDTRHRASGAGDDCGVAGIGLGFVGVQIRDAAHGHAGKIAERRSHRMLLHDGIAISASNRRVYPYQIESYNRHAVLPGTNRRHRAACGQAESVGKTYENPAYQASQET